MRDTGEDNPQGTPADAVNSRHSGGAHARHGRPRSRTRRVGPVIGGVLLALLALLIVWGVTLGLQARSAVGKARSAQSSLQGFERRAKSALTSGDGTRVTALASDPRLVQAQNDIASVDHTVNSPLWAPLTLLPRYGADVAVARGLASIGDEALTQVVPQALRTLGKAQSGRLTTDGTVNVAALRTLHKNLAPLSARLTRLSDRAKALPAGNITALDLVRTKTVSALGSASRTASSGTDALTLLIRLLGTGTQHTYVLAGTTPAELRSSAGLTGSIGELRVGQGRLSIGSFSSNRTFLSQGPILQSAEASQIFSIPTAVYSFDVRDIGLDPDFSGIAQSLLTVWKNSDAGKGSDPQGAIVVDPVFVQELIRLTGSVTSPDGTVLTGQNAADYLDYGIYAKHPDNDTQDAVFASIVGITADRLMKNLSGKTLVRLAQDMPSLVSGRHLQMYSTDPDVQRLVARFGLTRAPQTSAAKPALGLYIGSYNSSKMDYFNKRAVSAKQTGGPTKDGVAGRRTYTVRLRITNTLDPSQVASTPGYVLAGRGRKDALTEFLLVYAPKGGTVKATGEPTGFAPFTWNGKSLLRTYYSIPSGSSSTYTFRVTTAPKATKGLTFDQSPSCR